MDNDGTIIIPSSISDGTNAWVRECVGQEINVLWFGAKGDNSNDDATAIQTAITYALSSKASSTTEFCMQRVVCPAGKIYKLGRTLTIASPLSFYCYGALYFTPTTGDAVAINKTSNSNWFGYDIFIDNLRSVNGNTASPTSINASGTVGLHIYNTQWSSSESFSSLLSPEQDSTVILPIPLSLVSTYKTTL